MQKCVCCSESHWLTALSPTSVEEGDSSNRPCTQAPLELHHKYCRGLKNKRLFLGQVAQSVFLSFTEHASECTSHEMWDKNLTNCRGQNPFCWNQVSDMTISTEPLNGGWILTQRSFYEFKCGVCICPQITWFNLATPTFLHILKTKCFTVNIDSLYF